MNLVKCQNCGSELSVASERCSVGDSGAHAWRTVVTPAVEMFDSRTANRIVAWLEAQGLIQVATMVRKGAWRHEG